MTPELTQNKLKELLHYDPETGVFTWRVRTSKSVHIGDLAGCLGNGYVLIRLCSVLYLAHRLAWLYMEGRWPVDQTDHKNGIRSDNRWENLREASGSLNQQNQRKAHKSGTTRFLGVRCTGKRFQAQINLDGKQCYLGTYPTPELAHEAYRKAKRAMHPGCTI